MVISSQIIVISGIFQLDWQPKKKRKFLHLGGKIVEPISNWNHLWTNP